MALPVLLGCEGISKAYGVDPLFADLTFSLREGDHVGLVGPNGTGKSTLLKILAGTELPDEGTRSCRKSLRVGYVPQDSVFEPGLTPEEVLRAALDARRDLDEQDKTQRVAVALSRAGFTERSARTDVLSGGWLKRLAVARELVLDPDVLLLDEPTNHLDVDGILWLEALLRAEPEAFVVVSHDRYFLQNVARRMLELDPRLEGGLLQVDGGYVDLLEARDELLRHQAAYQQTLANLVRHEVEWLRRGAKARTSKSKSRIDRAEQLQGELKQSRTRAAVSTAGIDFQASGRKTKRLWTGKGLSKSFDATPIVRDLDLVLAPGMRLGILGPNASGKTTLLRMIVGEIEPDRGEIKRADSLRTVYFEQHRDRVDPSTTLRRALAPQGDSVIYRDRSLHVASWAKRFLFGPEQLDMPVSRMSGGERSRILLARLMLEPADLLVLDEPTNDLDIPTLDVLEQSLLEFPGAIVLVTHDRFLLDRVSTEILTLDGRGNVERFADYAQWESKRSPASPRKKQPSTASPDPERRRTGSTSLHYMEQREWDSMEQSVLAAEARVGEAERLAEDPAIATNAEALQRRLDELSEARQEVDRLYARWAELEAKLHGSTGEPSRDP